MDEVLFLFHGKLSLDNKKDDRELGSHNTDHNTYANKHTHQQNISKAKIARLQSKIGKFYNNSIGNNVMRSVLIKTNRKISETI